jgi:hypothetical protein
VTTVPIETYRDETLLLAHAANVVYGIWRGSPTVAHARALERVFTAMTKAHPRGYLLLSVGITGFPRPTQEARDELVRLVANHAIAPRAAAQVVAMEGFTGAGARALIGTILLIARPAVPIKVFADVAAATDWLGAEAARLASARTVLEMRRLYEALVASF